MHIETLFILGAGGHAKVVLEAIERLGSPWNVVVCTDDPSQTGQSVMGLVIQPANPNLMRGSLFHIAIGNNNARRQRHIALQQQGCRPLVICHPNAVIARTAVVGSGSFVAAGAIIGPDSHIGSSVIVNHGAVVDHEVIVGDFAHIAPTATLAGNVHIGEGTLIGAGANVLPGLKVGLNVVVGAGAVVTRDVTDNHVHAGVPARRI